MALTVITTSGLVSGTAHGFAADGDALYVPEGIFWGSSNGALWSTPLNRISVTLAGQAITAGGITNQTGDGFSLTITETGSLVSFRDTPTSTVLGFNGSTGAGQNMMASSGWRPVAEQAHGGCRGRPPVLAVPLRLRLPLLCLVLLPVSLAPRQFHHRFRLVRLSRLGAALAARA